MVTGSVSKSRPVTKKAKALAALAERKARHPARSSVQPGLDRVIEAALALEEPFRKVLELIHSTREAPAEARPGSGVTLLAFPSDKKVQILKAIAGATGLSATEAKEHIENLPVTLRGCWQPVWRKPK